MNKKILSVILFAVIICSSAACSSGNNDPSANDKSSEAVNTVSAPTDELTFPEIDTDNLPSKVDLRNYDGKNYVTPIKCQNHGDCWTFSLAAAAETSYLFANDMGVPAGEVNDKVDFSEKYISWYVLHDIGKDDVAKGRVRASQIGEGFDPSKAESSKQLAVYYVGGAFVHGANLFGSGFGPVDESLSVNGEYPYAYNDESSLKWTLPQNASYRCATTNAYLRNSFVLPCPATIDKDGNYVFNEEGLNAIRSELYKGHCVSVSVNATNDDINMDNMASYYHGDRSPDHGVTIVGYDDNFPKEKFTRITSSGEAFEGSTPPGDGAFIIKNSWGLMGRENDPDDGYYFLSYYDHCINGPVSYEFEASGASGNTSYNYDQYDMMMTQWYVSTDYANETRMANVFDAEEDENLVQISYITSNDKTEVAYEIYRVTDDNDPTSGTLLESGVDSHLYAGSHKTDLKSQYPLKKGEKYSVVLTMRHKTEEGNIAYMEIVPYATEFYKGITVKGIINKGESYLYTDGKWKDMSEMKSSPTERACRQCTDEVVSNTTLPKIDPPEKDKMAIDNYPIKAILTPAG